ncbi:outer membrane beta-barrel protein [Vibrio nigripulchritudo]|uniref:outer membrane beta-barrel protein n=1 Tax=Vibrio nigripulchritudo TaxID=28173 RepID=UPI0005FA4E37|nr:outer membrane beta-barrel protein [Vibrio nigripulchritudo]KJY69171.1 hypothetical protein TW74_25330 [Vibrio nigripulchritudo]
MKKIALTVLISVSSASAMAEGNFYVGADIAKSNYDAITNFKAKNKGMGFAVQGGYEARTSEYFALGAEVEYLKQSGVEYSANMGSISAKSDINVSSVNFNLKPKLYLGNLYLATPVGGAYVMVDGKVEASAKIMGQTIKVSQKPFSDGFGLTYGAEIGYDIMEQFTVKAGAKKVIAESTTFYAGVGYKF